MPNETVNGERYWTRKTVDNLARDMKDTVQSVGETKEIVSGIAQDVKDMRKELQDHIAIFNGHIKDDDRRFAEAKDDIASVRTGILNLDWKTRMIILAMVLGSGGIGGYVGSLLG